MWGCRHCLGEIVECLGNGFGFPRVGLLLVRF